MQTIFVDRAKSFDFDIPQSTKKRSAYIEELMTFVHRADHRITAAACRFTAPTFEANEPFALRQLKAASLSIGLDRSSPKVPESFGLAERPRAVMRMIASKPWLRRLRPT